MCARKITKTERLYFRIKPSDKAVVKAIADRLGMKVSDYLNKLLFDNLYFEIEKQRGDVANERGDS